MTAPYIGITTYGENEERQFVLPREYVDSIRCAGGIPILITPGETQLTKIIDQLDSLILAGGGDLNPEYYSGEHHASIYIVAQQNHDHNHNNK